MGRHTTLFSAVGSFGGRLTRHGAAARREAPHIVDQLIAERTPRLSRHPLWPLAQPLLYRFLHYRQAVAMADRIAEMSGWDAFAHISALLSLNISSEGVENIPAVGGFILAPTHPTGIADGIAVFDLLKALRPDMAFFANRDALRLNERFRDLIIPVEWRAEEKTRAKSRDALAMTARAFTARRAVVLFPAGRIAYWHGGRLTERPWQPSVVALARRYGVPVVPVNIAARNSGLFYFMSRYSTELRDMTLFHELLNKKGRHVHMTVGRPIPPEALEGDQAAVTAALQAHAVTRLAEEPTAHFELGAPSPV